MPAMYVVRAVDNGQPVPDVFRELRAGRARIGWSYHDKLDLRLIAKKRWKEDLDEDEKEAIRCLRFYTDVNSGDYLIYPHQPKRGKFSIVQVTGEYDYSTVKDSLNEDFRSFRPCELKTPEPVDWYDNIVSSHLRTRLGLQGRFYQPNTDFDTFLKRLPEAGHQQDGSNQVIAQRIREKIRKNLPDEIHKEFCRADLSRRFCRDLFERMGYSSLEVQEGPSEAGSDIVVTFGSVLLPVEFRVGVQAFSYPGCVEEASLNEKLEQLLEGWDRNSLDYGVLLTTGRCTEPAREVVKKHNRENQRKKVRLIDAETLADLFLKYFPPNLAGIEG